MAAAMVKPTLEYLNVFPGSPIGFTARIAAADWLRAVTRFSPSAGRLNWVEKEKFAGAPDVWVSSCSSVTPRQSSCNFVVSPKLSPMVVPQSSFCRSIKRAIIVAVIDLVIEPTCQRSLTSS